MEKELAKTTQMTAAMFCWQDSFRLFLLLLCANCNIIKSLQNQILSSKTFFFTSDPNKAYKEAESPVEWLPYSTEGKEYMVLKTGSPLIEQGLRYRKCRFWGEVYPLLVKSIQQSK